MSTDYGVFEASSTDGHEEEQRRRQATRDLGRAIEAAREGFGDFLGSASDKQDYQDRLALVMNDLMQKVADSGVMPVPGVMRKVKAALRPEFRTAAPHAGNAGHHKQAEVYWYDENGRQEAHFAGGEHITIFPDGKWEVSTGTFMTSGQAPSVERAKAESLEALSYIAFGSRKQAGFTGGGEEVDLSDPSSLSDEDLIYWASSAGGSYISDSESDAIDAEVKARGFEQHVRDVQNYKVDWTPPDKYNYFGNRKALRKIAEVPWYKRWDRTEDEVLDELHEMEGVLQEAIQNGYDSRSAEDRIRELKDELAHARSASRKQAGAYDSSSIPGMYAQWAEDQGLDPHSNETLAEFGKQFSGLTYDMQQDIAQEFLSSRKRAFGGELDEGEIEDAKAEFQHFLDLYAKNFPLDTTEKVLQQFKGFAAGPHSKFVSDSVLDYLGDMIVEEGLFTASRKTADIDFGDAGVYRFLHSLEFIDGDGLDDSLGEEDLWDSIKSEVDFDRVMGLIDDAYQSDELSKTQADRLMDDLRRSSGFYANRKQALESLNVDGTEYQVGFDNQRREILAGTMPDGSEVRGYKTAFGTWVAYRSGEIGWSDLPPQPTPEDAVRKMNERNPDHMRSASRKRASAYLPVVSVEQDTGDSYMAELKGGFAFEAYDEGGAWVWNIFDSSGEEVASDETFSLDAAKDDAAYALERVASRKVAVQWRFDDMGMGDLGWESWWTVPEESAEASNGVQGLVVEDGTGRGGYNWSIQDIATSDDLRSGNAPTVEQAKAEVEQAMSRYASRKQAAATETLILDSLSELMLNGSLSPEDQDAIERAYGQAESGKWEAAYNSVTFVADGPDLTSSENNLVESILDDIENLVGDKSRTVSMHKTAYQPGETVYWVSDSGYVHDTMDDSPGTVIAFPAVDPDGNVHDEMVEVEWEDEGYDIVSIDNLTTPKSFSGSRKAASERAL